ncbi:MAG: CCA tRNA nucleotidyltransferase [SAR202 cluster bacterium]|nr:CCA tRNA nucleotidyltransferase [SAR202 cluster bacterium]|tara:strand:- start:18329 stop:19561 length:1233 start_codon:yes stop_codon:yes gene_type:complete
MEPEMIGNPIELIREQLGHEYAELLVEITRTATLLGFGIFIVGGTVRDLILKRDLKDIDLSVTGDAILLVDEVSKSLDVDIVRYRKFRTATIKTGRIEIDVVSARSEIYPNSGALPEVKLGDIHDDLKRRDFTINAMAISINEPYHLVDSEDGRSDLSAGTVRVLHNRSFIDDPTRLFRMFRYASRFDFDIDENTYIAAKSAISKQCLATISKERLTNEVLLMLEEPHVDNAFRYFIEFDVLGLPVSANEKISIEHTNLEFKWIALLSMYREDCYEQFCSMFSLDRKNTNMIKDYIDLCSLIKTNDLLAVDRTNISATYFLLKQVPRPVMDAYVACHPNQLNVNMLMDYMMYTDQVKINLDPIGLINLGVDRHHISDVMDILMIGALTGKIASRSDEEKAVVQYVNEHKI